MKYTIIFKSAWQGEQWTLGRTYGTKQKAQSIIDTHLSSDAKDDFFNMRIMKHRKSIESLTDHDTFMVKFSDGTKAEDRSFDPHYDDNIFDE